MLTYSAHISGGHFAIESIPANTSVRFDLLASSYNGQQIKPERVFVGNAGNGGNVSIKIAGIIASMTPPYSNDTIDVADMLNIEIANEGSNAISVMFADAGMKTVAAGIFASLAVSAVESENHIVNNFEIAVLTDIINEGTESGVTYTLPAGSKLSGSSKFGTRALSNTIATLDASGMLITAPGLFNMANDFTLTAWMTHGGAIQSCFRIGADNASLNNSLTWWFPTTSQISLNMEGTTDNTAITNMTSGAFVHIAITKIGTALRFFQNGLYIAGLDQTCNSTNVYNTLGVMYSGLNNATYRCGAGKVDAVRYLDGIGLWDDDFTPPTSPPV